MPSSSKTAQSPVVRLDDGSFTIRLVATTAASQEHTAAVVFPADIGVLSAVPISDPGFDHQRFKDSAATWGASESAKLRAWYDRLKPTCEAQWKAMGIDQLLAQLTKPIKNDYFLVNCLASFWDRHANAFVFPAGTITPTTADMALFFDVPVDGDPRGRSPI